MSRSLSVVMPVYNAMPYLAEAIESILAQSFQDFIFIIGDDGSTDGSLDCIMDYARKDARIEILQHSERLGPSRSSNWVANAATTPFVARMDADDIAHPQRLEMQMNALLAHPDAVLIGSLYDMIDASGKLLWNGDRWRYLIAMLPPIGHPTIVYRREYFAQIGGYDEQCNYFEDSDLYERISKLGPILMMPEALCKVRLGGTSSRLNDDRTAVENQIDRFWSRRNGSVVADGVAKNRKDWPSRVAPSALVAVASLRLWSGLPPTIFLRMLKRMRFLPIKESFLPFIWGISVTISPQIVRKLVTWINIRRNSRASENILNGHVYRWNPDGPSYDLGPINTAENLGYSK